VSLLAAAARRVHCTHRVTGEVFRKALVLAVVAKDQGPRDVVAWLNARVIAYDP
jgi:hypothetical protein